MRLATTITSLVLMLGVLLQSCAAAVGSGLSTNQANKDSFAAGGYTGLLVALLFLLGGAFVMGFPRLAMLLFLGAGVIGIAGGSSTAFKDLTVWGVVAFVLAVMSFFGWRGKRRDKLKEKLLLGGAQAQVALASTVLAPAARPARAGGFCPHCGVLGSTGDRFCRSCGRPVDFPAPPAMPSSTT